MKVYLAAPLFNEQEQELNRQICAVLEPTLEVYLPQRDGIIVAQLVENGLPMAEAVARAYSEDIAAIRSSDLVFASFNGRVPDEGVCIEIGFARALDLPVIGYKSDAHTAFPWGNNPMIDGCVETWLATLDELETWVSSMRGAH